MDAQLEWLYSRLGSFSSSGLSRSLRLFSSRSGSRIRINNFSCVNLAGNDYLGLSQHPLVLSSFVESLESFGLGSSASRLVSGNLSPHESLEQELSAFKSYPSALLFPTGYQSNLAAISSLTDSNTIIYSDSQNHASIVDGCRLSRAECLVYPHLDLGFLSSSMEKNHHHYPRSFVVTDAVFSTDGSIAPLPELFELCLAHDAWLLVDEAHSTGVMGPKGAGACASFGIHPQVQTATLSKAFGGMGGVVFGDRLVTSYLVHAGRPFMYTTAPPPALASSMSSALGILSGAFGDLLRERLWRNVGLFSSGLRDLGFSVFSHSHILSILINDPHLLTEAASFLLEQGVLVAAFRPPTVPRDCCLLRITPSSLHSDSDIDLVLAAFKRLFSFLSSKRGF